jgi:uncharacterized protein with von Willebrand factor type A (vWA) domain
VSELVDLPWLASAFGRALHEAGIPTTPERSVRFARALSMAPPATRGALYCTARTVFVSAHEQLPEFDRVFAAIFDGSFDPADARGDPNAPPLHGVEAGRRKAQPPARAMSEPAAGGGPPPAGLTERPAGEEPAETDRAVPLAAASADERLAERDFAELDADELRALRALMRELSLAPPLRRARRRRRDPQGRWLDVRATLRTSCRTGGDPSRRVMRRRVERPRQVVLLCDISGSMEPYTRAFLQFLHAGVGGAKAEAFVFATRLTRLTRALQSRQPDLAIERAAAAARDWSGGTRIGESLRRFNDEHGRRGMARGAVVVILSDGWERGDPDLVAREMQRLRRLAYRIVWVNPRKAAREYEPLAAGMAAALPSCDAFVSGHNLRALEAVTEAIAAGGRHHRRYR